MPRSFPDSSVLIDAPRASRSDHVFTALRYFNDPGRTFLTSPFVRLEAVPKAHYTRRSQELAFYEGFFGSPFLEWCSDLDRMETIAEEQARRFGLAALDALHIAAAHLLRADELVTVKRSQKPIHRTDLVRVIHVYDLGW